MAPAGVVTIIAVVLISGALALYLTIIAIKLNEVTFNLGTILIGVWSIANQCAPLGEVIGDVVSDVEAMEQDMNRLPIPGSRAARSARARKRVL